MSITSNAAMAPVLAGSWPAVDAALEAAAEQFGHRVAFVSGERRLTYAQWNQAAAAVSGLLIEAGATRGSVVCILLPSSIEFAVAYVAACRLGAVATAVNNRFGPLEVDWIIDRAHPTVVIGESMVGADLSSAAVISNAELQAAMEGRPAKRVTEDRDREDAAAISWTSGTTGAPKGAWYSHRALEAASRMSGLLSAPYDRRIMSTPFAHVGFLTRVWDLIAWATTAVITQTEWSAQDMLEVLADERITVGQGVPTQWEKLLALPGLDSADLSSLRVVGTGSTRVPPELITELRNRLGCPVLVRYACSEVPIAMSTAPDDPPDVAANTIGRPAAGVELALVDDQGRRVRDGEPGRIAMRSEVAMSGYWRDPEATAEVMSADGWIRTGDVARITERGDVEIVGRASEMYIRGGYNVQPLEVERVLLRHPAIEDVAVIGVPAPVIGEIGIAFVVLAGSGHPPLAVDLQRWCRRYLADFKAPDRIEFVPDLPRNALMKVDKRALRAMVQ